MRLRLVPQDTAYDFFRFRKLTMGISGVALVISLVAWLGMGLNFGIDFLGGTTIRTESTTEVSVGAYRDAIAPLELGDVSITEVFDPNFAADQHVAMIRIQAQSGQESVASDTVALVEEALGGPFGGRLIAEVAGVGSLDALLLALEAAGFPAQVEGGRLAFAAELPMGSVDAIKEALRDADGRTDVTEFAYETLSFPSVESVGPKVSGELIQTALLALGAAIAAMLFYIWLRFEWQFAVGAVAALVHDVLLTIGIFSLLQIRFDLATIAALLTVLGYSINDTVVIFDRLRENLIKFKKTPLIEVMNRSVNETLSRTLMTSVTTMLALIALIVLGGDVIRGFVFAILWGVIVGTYSSVYVAKNVVLFLGVTREPKAPGGGAGTQFGDVKG